MKKEPQGVFIRGDLTDTFLDVEDGVAAPLRVTVQLPDRVRIGVVKVGEDENGDIVEARDVPVPGERWTGRLIARRDLPGYALTYDVHCDGEAGTHAIRRVAARYIWVDLTNVEVFNHVAQDVCDLIDGMVVPFNGLFRRFERGLHGHIHGWEMVGEDDEGHEIAYEWSNIRAEGAALCEETDIRVALRAALFAQGFAGVPAEAMAEYALDTWPSEPTDG